MNQLELEMDLLNFQIIEPELAPSYNLPLVHLQKLCNLVSSPVESNNPSPWKCVKEGSYLLGNAYDLVKFYKEFISGPVDNRDIAIIDAFLRNMGFDRSHITNGYTDEAYDGKAICFVSEGQGKKYYELLHSTLIIHVRYFIELVEKYVNERVIHFLETMREELKSKLFKAVEDNDCSEVEDCFKCGTSHSLKDKLGWTLLHRAVNSGNINLVKILLNNDADITLVTDHENYTVLHVATSRGNTEMVQLLLERVSQDLLFYLVNARMSFNKNTSLHIAAKNGNDEIVKVLLKYGAMYNIENNAGELPITLSKNQWVTCLLKSVDILFKGARTSSSGYLCEQLKALRPDEITYLLNARNNEGNTLLQFCIINDYSNLVMILLDMHKKKS